jgi:WD40 repeat protein
MEGNDQMQKKKKKKIAE